MRLINKKNSVFSRELVSMIKKEKRFLVPMGEINQSKKEKKSFYSSETN